jgi:hypothetical protein
MAGAAGTPARHFASFRRALQIEAHLSSRFQRKAGAVSMRRYLSMTSGMLTALVAGTLLLISPAISMAGTPALGADCGTGAAIAGSDSAGKVKLGVGVSTCTLTFSVPYTNAPACAATNETNGGGYSLPVGAKTTHTTVDLNSISPWLAGDVVSYLCQDY